MVIRPYAPDAGDVIKIDLNPRVGHEQAGWRPALVLSPSLYNAKTGLAIVAPITNHVKGYAFEVPLPLGMKTTGVILADAIKNADWRARSVKYVEPAPATVLAGVRERLALLLGLST